jgi:glycerol-3-phosphate acyltransferase PlsY
VTPAAAHWILLGLLPVAFGLGSVPFGVLVGRARGVDVRRVGSGNTGATNVGRALGKRFFYLVLALDALKALVPTLAASALVHAYLPPDERSPLTFFLWMAVGVAAVLGHVFSPFLGFRGGKGVACGLGLILGVVPFVTLPGLVAVAVFVVTFRLSRYVSLGSMAAAASLPVAYLAFALLLDWNLATQWPVLALLTLVAALVLWRHRDNVRRLRAGTEVKA